MKSAALLALALTGIAAGLPAHAETQPATAKTRFVLSCGAQMQTKTFVVDTARKTVDGNPASFTEITITWKTGAIKAAKKKGEKTPQANNGVTHELNRIEGTYRSWKDGETGETAVTYGCDKAGPTRF